MHCTYEPVMHIFFNGLPQCHMSFVRGFQVLLSHYLSILPFGPEKLRQGSMPPLQDGGFPFTYVKV